MKNLEEPHKFDIKKCKACHGEKKIKPMFIKQPCCECQETGYDLSDPIQIIKEQQIMLEKLKVVIIKQRNTIYDNCFSEEERMGMSVDRFYKKATRLD